MYGIPMHAYFLHMLLLDEWHSENETRHCKLVQAVRRCPRIIAARDTKRGCRSCMAARWLSIRGRKLDVWELALKMRCLIEDEYEKKTPKKFCLRRNRRMSWSIVWNTCSSDSTVLVCNADLLSKMPALPMFFTSFSVTIDCNWTQLAEVSLLDEWGILLLSLSLSTFTTWKWITKVLAVERRKRRKRRGNKTESPKQGMQSLNWPRQKMSAY